MRIGSKTSDEFLSSLEDVHREIQEAFAARMAERIVHVPAKVMLGDTTITEQNTFDPASVEGYFGELAASLAKTAPDPRGAAGPAAKNGRVWEVQNVQTTSNDDIRRIFAKFESNAGSYVMTGHVSVQFHVLLYYRPDHRVVDIQRELAAIMDEAARTADDASARGDRIISEKLQKMGYGNLSEERLFRILFENDDLREKLHEEAGADDAEAQNKKRALFDELDSLLVETYQTSLVQIDDARLVTGEEGFLCSFDLEFLRGGVREGVFDTRRMAGAAKRGIRASLEAFRDAL